MGFSSGQQADRPESAFEIVAEVIDDLNTPAHT